MNMVFISLQVCWRVP